MQNEQAAFLSLPPEIRRLIYKASLISSLSILISPQSNLICTFVSSSGNSHEVDPSKRPLCRVAHQTKVTVDSIRGDLALGLFCSNRMVSREAIDVFYGENAFTYPRDHEWDAVIERLDRIGAANRGRITKLQADVPKIWGLQQRLEKGLYHKADLYERRPRLRRFLQPISKENE